MYKNVLSNYEYFLNIMTAKKIIAAVLKVWSTDPWGYSRPFQSVPEVKTILIIMLRNYFSSSL